MRKTTFNFLIILILAVLAAALVLGATGGATDKIKDKIDNVIDNPSDGNGENTGDGGDVTCVHEYKTTYQKSTNMLHVMKKTCNKCGHVTEENKLHNWMDGVCMDCVTYCVHSGTTGTCSICGKVLTTACEHNGATQTVYEPFPSGTNYEKHGVGTFCTLCHEQIGQGSTESHQYTNGRCIKCDQICGHSGTTGICKYCGKDLAHVHSFSGITGVEYCSICDYLCEHDYSNYNGVCSYCGTNCTHADISDVNYSGLTIDGHTAQTECEVCYKILTNNRTSHSWNENNACSACGYVCIHSGQTGTCSYCGMTLTSSCSHNFEYGSCTGCGLPCSHVFSDIDVCTICALPCPHTYQNSICTQCGWSCPHTVYDGPSCYACGYTP